MDSRFSSCLVTWPWLHWGEAKPLLEAGAEVWQESEIPCVRVQGEDGERRFHEEVHPRGQNHQASPHPGVGRLHRGRVLAPAQPGQHELRHCQGASPGHRGRQALKCCRAEALPLSLVNSCLVFLVEGLLLHSSNCLLLQRKMKREPQKIIRVSQFKWHWPPEAVIHSSDRAASGDGTCLCSYLQCWSSQSCPQRARIRDGEADRRRVGRSYICICKYLPHVIPKGMDVETERWGSY